MGVNILQFSILQLYPSLIHGVSTADFGNLSYRYGSVEEVTANRKKLFSALEVNPNRVTTMQLAHGCGISETTESSIGKGILTPEQVPNADILVTNKPGTFLFTIVADCLALFLYEPDEQVCALAHAGWKGVEQRVPLVTVQYMVDKFGCNPNKIRIGMSPAIHKESLRFPTDQVQQYQLPGWEPYLHPVGSDTEIDFIRYAYDQLIEAGIQPNNIENCNIDTRQDFNFYSHRRSVEDGEAEARFGCLIGFTT